MKKVSKIIFLILAVVLIFFAIALVVKFTNGMQESFKTYYLRLNGKDIVSEAAEMVFITDKDYDFTVKNTFGKLQKFEDFDVVVKPSSYVDFDYYVDDEKQTWQNCKANFTELFVKKTDNGFVMNPTVENMTELFERIYLDKQVVLPDIDSDIKPFELVVSRKDSNTQYHIYFSFYNIAVGLDQSALVF